MFPFEIFAISGMKKLRSFLLNNYTCRLYLIHNIHEQTLQACMD